MQDRDALAAGRALLRSLVALGAFWSLVLAAPLLFGGLSRSDAIFLAATAFGMAALLHGVRLLTRKARPVRSGAMAGLGPGDWWEVTDAVRQGRAVSDPALAGAALAHARDRLRWQSVGRVALPVVIVLRVIVHFTDPPGPGANLGYLAVVIAPMAILWIFDLLGHRRSQESQERNRDLVQGPW